MQAPRHSHDQPSREENHQEMLSHLASTITSTTVAR